MDFLLLFSEFFVVFFCFASIAVDDDDDGDDREFEREILYCKNCSDCKSNCYHVPITHGNEKIFR